MATGTQPDAGQILNSLINSILLIDDNLAIHYANPAAQQLLAQSSRKLFGTPLPELLSYFSLNIELMQESLEAGQGFTDNEVTLVIDGIKSAKHQRIDGEKSPCRDGLKFPRQLKTSPIRLFYLPF